MRLDQDELNGTKEMVLEMFKDADLKEIRIHIQEYSREVDYSLRISIPKEVKDESGNN